MGNGQLTLFLISVLYQRGIYPPEDFKVVKKYGLNVLVTTDDEVKNYIKRIMNQLSRTVPFSTLFVEALLTLLVFRVDERWQDIKVGYGHRFKRHGRDPGTMAIRYPDFWKAASSKTRAIK